MSAPAVDFLGLPFARLDLAGALAWVRAASQAPGFRYAVTPNVDHMVRLLGGQAEPWHPAFDAAERGADLILNDSRVLQRLARLSGVALPVVPGSDLTRALLAGGVPADTPVALVGGGAADAAWLRARFPHLTHVEPPMGVLRDAAAQAAIVDALAAARPRLTLFAIGAPQSEIVAHRVRADGRAGGVGLCIGASIEFLTGAKRRAPALLQRLGLEWSFRLLSEPRRLGRRYLVEGPRIFGHWRRWVTSRRP